MKVPTLEEQNLEIRAECQRLADFLVAKNTAYGGQALAPIAIVSKGDPLDIIFARMDDKLSRILRGRNAGEDPWQDLRGYITLWQVVLSLKKRGFYAKVEEPVPDNSAMPMPIGQRFAPAPVPDPIPNQSVEISFDDELHFDGETPERPGTLELGEGDDPTSLPVTDIAAITSQTVSSLQPSVPEKFEEKSLSDVDETINSSEDPWIALQRPTRKRGGTIPITPESDI